MSLALAIGHLGSLSRLRSRYAAFLAASFRFAAGFFLAAGFFAAVFFAGVRFAAALAGLRVVFFAAVLRAAGFFVVAFAIVGPHLVVAAALLTATLVLQRFARHVFFYLLRNFKSVVAMQRCTAVRCARG
jgi:hypothetical protein